MPINDKDKAVPVMSNFLFDGLLATAEPVRPFAELGGNRRYRYQDIFDVSARFANVLVSYGVQPGDRVAVQVPKSIEAVMLYLATVRAGAVFLPLNTAYTISELAYFLEDAEPRLLVCDPQRLDEYAPLAAAKHIQLETLGVWENPHISAGSLADVGLNASTQFNTVSRAADDLAAILYTSGTTGRSKGAMLTHHNLLSNAQVLTDYWQFTSEDVLLHALPIFHTHGLFVACNVSMLAGASMQFLTGFDIDNIIDSLPHSTVMMGVPTFYTRLLDEPRLTAALVAHMRVFISGSAPLLADTHTAFEARTGHRILERYGMTETNMNTSNPYLGERRAGTVGCALPGIDLRIVDAESGSTLSNGDIGMIEVRGPNVFKGYWQMPAKTAQEFRADGFFITGDLGRIDNEGYLHIVGRGKDLIISGGYNIYPKEIESVLDTQAGVIESAVIGVPHRDFGESVVAVVAVAPGSQCSQSALIDAAAGELARFKLPKKVFFVDELPRNSMGKVQKNLLRTHYQDAFGFKN